MSTIVESNSITSKFEVNSNIKIDGDELGDKAEPAGKVADGLKFNAVLGEVDMQLEQKKQQNHTFGEGQHNNLSGEESVSGSLYLNGETVNSMDPNMDPNMNAEVSVVVNGEGAADESGDISRSSAAGGSDSPAALESPQNDNSKIPTESPTLQAQIDGHDGETDSIDSGKSSKKKKGFLSGGLHIHMPKFSSRLSFGSDVSATSSELDGSPEKKKKKKDKRNKKKQNLTTNDEGDQDNATPSEYTESIASDRADQLDGAVSLNDTGLDIQFENEEEMNSGGDGQVSSNSKDEGENIQEGSPSDAVEMSSPEPVLSNKVEPEENEQIEKMDVDETPAQEQEAPAKGN